MKAVGFSVTAAAMAMLLSGCALIGGGSKPLDTFELTAPGADAARTRGRTQILIAVPTALKALDSENIVIRTGPGSIQYLKGAQWSDRLPNIVQTKLAQTFQRSGNFAGVGLPGQGLAIDYQILAELRSFDVRVDGGEHAQLEVFVKILNDRNGTVRASRNFTAMAPVSGTGNDAYVAALDAAFGQLAAEVVAWTDGVI